MPPAEAVSYLVNWAVAVSMACGAGLVAIRICRRHAAPLRHGVLLWTLVLLLLSPAAVWLAGQNGLAIIRLDLSDRPDAPAAGIVKETVPCIAESAASPSGNGFTAGNGPPPGLPRDRMGMPSESAFSDRPGDVAPPVPVVASEASRSDAGDRARLLPEKSPRLAWWRVIGALAAWLWAIGTVVALLRLGWGYLALARFCRRLTPLLDPGLDTIAREAANAVGLHKPPPLFLSRWVSVPVSIGLIKPAIVLPDAMAEESDAGQLQAVLLHEMAHIARRDHWVGLGQRLAAVLFWWNPLVYRVGYELAELREEICDNYVMSVHGGGQRLARILVELAERAVIRPYLPSTVGMLEPRLAGLSGRVTRLLNKERNMETRMSLGSKVSLLTCGLAVLIGMSSVGGLRLASAGPAITVARDAPASMEEAQSAFPNMRPVDQPTTQIPTSPLAAQSLQPPNDLWKSVTERLSRRLHFRGRVVDPAGNGLPGASVYLFQDPIEMRHASPAGILPTKVRAVSGADGIFAFTMEGSEFVVPPRYPCFIIAMADGFGPGLQKASTFERTGILESFRADVIGPLPDDEKGEPVVRLAKDDVPLTGRIVDAKGQPVTGADVRVLTIRVDEKHDLTRWLKAVEKEHADFAVESAYHSDGIPIHQFPQLMTTRTAPDGRFHLTGIGRERIVELLIAGPGIESIIVHARTRPGKTIVVPDPIGMPNPKNWNFYGADFEHAGNPSIPIVGTVKDVDTGKPLPGVIICQRSHSWEPVFRIEAFVYAVTDARGNYRLTGVPVDKKRWVVAAPPLDQPYLCASKAIDIPANADSCNVDFQLKRGIWIRGNVTDVKTGHPLQAGIEYSVFRDNPHAKTAPDFEDSWPINDSYWTDRNGSYAVPGLPGRGIVSIHVDGYEHYCYASGVGAEKISGAHVSRGWGGATGMMVYDTYPNTFWRDSKTALVEVNLAEEAESVQHDFQLVSACRLVGLVLDLEGKPLTGAFYSGFHQTSSFTYWRMDSEKFTINAYEPDQPRTVLFVHPEQKLAGSLILKGPQSSPLRVKLQPWGAITGRLVDQDGKPMAGALIAHYQFKEPNDPQEGFLPTNLYKKARDGSHQYLNADFPTDRDGRFRIEGLAPGIKYSPWVWDQKAAEPVGELISEVTVESGETKDLGNLTLKPLERASDSGQKAKSPATWSSGPTLEAKPAAISAESKPAAAGNRLQR